MCIAKTNQNVEYDVRCDADNIGGQHQPEELPILRRRRQFRTAHGLHAGRKGQTDGQSEGDPGATRGDGDEARRGRKGARFPPEADQRQPPPGKQALSIPPILSPFYSACLEDEASWCPRGGPVTTTVMISMDP